jgi:enterochelin esterase-like enzyme
MSWTTRKRAGMAGAVFAAMIGASLTTTVAAWAHGRSADAGQVTSAAATASAAATTAPAVVTAPAAPTAAPSLSIPTSADSLPGHVVTSALDGHSVLVYVPGAYDALPTTGFPVVYFLHGSPGTAEGWITGGGMPSLLDNLIATGQMPPTIAVIPDDQGVVSDDSYWGNTALGDTVETWFVNDLVPTIDDTYRTLGARYRGIAGLSAGGFGSVNLALHHPGLFSWVASYSGVFTGPDRLFGALSAANSPELTVSSLPAGERFPLYLGGGAQDTEFLPDSQQFIATVDALGWTAPLKTEIVPGPHGWAAWDVEAQDSLVWLGQLWGRA